MTNLYIDKNGLSYILDIKSKTATIDNKTKPKIIDIYPEIVFENVFYEVKFPSNCGELFFGGVFESFTLRKLHRETTNITNMNKMFYGCCNLKTLDLSNLNTENVTNMGSMFQSCDKLNELNIINFNTKEVMCMRNMFYGCECLQSIVSHNFYISGNTTVCDMFYRCNSLKHILIPNISESAPLDIVIGLQ